MSEHISTASLRRQAIFWLIAMTVFVLFLLVFRSILLPFLAGLALAYFLDPVADFLERRGFSRIAATVFILLMFIVLFVIALMVVVPILASQLAEFIERLPGYMAQLQVVLANISLDTTWIAEYIGVEQNGLQYRSSRKSLTNSAPGA